MSAGFQQNDPRAGDLRLPAALAWAVNADGADPEAASRTIVRHPSAGSAAFEVVVDNAIALSIHAPIRSSRWPNTIVFLAVQRPAIFVAIQAACALSAPSWRIITIGSVLALPGPDRRISVYCSPSRRSLIVAQSLPELGPRAISVTTDPAGAGGHPRRESRHRRVPPDRCLSVGDRSLLPHGQPRASPDAVACAWRGPIQRFVTGATCNVDAAMPSELPLCAEPTGRLTTRVLSPLHAE